MGTEEAKKATPQTTPPATPAPAVPAAEVPKGNKTSFDVYNSSDVLARTYTVEEHGPKAGELAKEYATKIAGSVK